MFGLWFFFSLHQIFAMPKYSEGAQPCMGAALLQTPLFPTAGLPQGREQGSRFPERSGSK